MYANLVLVGDGTDGDPFRVNMPNCQTVSVNYDEGWARVSFMTRYGPPHAPPFGSPLYPLIDGVYVLIGLPEDDVLLWWQRLATMFPGHDPAYTPSFPV